MSIKKYKTIEISGNVTSEDYSLYFPHTRRYIYNGKPSDIFKVTNCLLSDSLLIHVRNSDKSYPLMYVNNSDIRDYSYQGVTIEPDVDSYSVTIKIDQKDRLVIFEFVNLGKAFSDLSEFKDRPLEVTPIFE